MKAFIIFTDPLKQSVANAKQCFESFRRFKGWDVELFNGCNPLNLAMYETRFGLSNDRSHITIDKPYFITKKSCFYSHFELWIKVIEIGEPVTIVEHDTECVGSWKDHFSIEHGAMQLTAESILSSKLTHQGRTFPQDYEKIIETGEGIHQIEFTQKNHRGHTCMAGGVGYTITPSAAELIVADCFNSGWYQNDLLISTEYFPLYYIHPVLIKYLPNKELKSSSKWRT